MSGRPGVGTCDLLRFFTDRRRFPELRASDIAVVLALMLHVNTTGRGARKYHARPKRETLAKTARVTEPTVGKTIKYLRESGWIVVTPGRSGNRNSANEYDLTPAADWIAEQRTRRRPNLKLVEGGFGER